MYPLFPTDVLASAAQTVFFLLTVVLTLFGTMMTVRT